MAKVATTSKTTVRKKGDHVWENEKRVGLGEFSFWVLFELGFGEK